MCAGTEFSNVRFKGDDNRAEKVYTGVKALSADDVAETIYWSATLPSHMNINVLEVMPVHQSFNAFNVYRDEL
jgi:3-hydroxy acid dehydrogenase/malonic semialdehyde reductase